MLKKVIGFTKHSQEWLCYLNICFFPRGGDFQLPVNRSLTVAVLFLAAGLAQAQPTNISVTPASGSGATQTFAFVGASASGCAYINMVQMLFNFGVDGRQACYLQYSPGSGTLTLIGDDGGTPQS